MSDRRTFRVIAKPWEEGWELHLEGGGVTQTGDLNGAEAMVRDYIALDLGIDKDSFDVEIVQGDLTEGFFEEDEPPEKILRAFRKGAKGRTAPRAREGT